MGEKRNANRLLARKPGGNKPRIRPRRRWVDNIKIDVGEIGWGVLAGLVWLRIETRVELL
jgi:hypothetical protein